MTDPVATRPETVEAILQKGRRTRGVPLRRSFIVRGDGAPPPLARLVRNGDGTALDLELLALALASGEPYDVELYADVWARALGLSPRTGGQVVSRAWRRLAGLNLVERGRRAGRRASVRILKEDGSGEPYLPPGKVNEAHLKVPFVYWRGDYYRSLSLKAKAVLLIALGMPPGRFELPKGRSAKRYGISEDTIEHGRQELRDNKLLQRYLVVRKAELAKEGMTKVYVCELIGDFARKPASSEQTYGEVVPLKVS